MSKSPEEYFKEQDFSSESESTGKFTPAEQAFMEKYMGLNAGGMLDDLGISPDSSKAVAPPQDEHSAMSSPKDLETIIRSENELLMVAFYLGVQEFVIPTVVVQEVIRTMPIARLPAAPPFVQGVVNLRGKVTPLIKLRDLLEVTSPRQGEDKFIVVCRRSGLQIGLIIERIHTMYRVDQESIDWNIESHLGINVDFIAGLLKLNQQLLGIVFVDKIIESILA